MNKKIIIKIENQRVIKLKHYKKNNKEKLDNIKN